MIECKECHSLEPEGTLYCNECGQDLLAAPDAGTPQLPFSDTLRLAVPPSALSYVPGAVASAAWVTFVVPGRDSRITMELRDEIRIGRADPATGVRPELDLSILNGQASGVSRMHAAIRASSLGVVLVDLGSSNGTRLNDYRLPPDLPYPLHNGDKIHFGQLLVKVYFD